MRSCLLPLPIILFVCYIVLLQFIVVAEVGDVWVNATYSYLQRVYTKHDYCVMTSADPLSCTVEYNNEVEEKCSSLMNQNRVKHRSHMFPQSMYHIPQEFNNENGLSDLTSLTDMLIKLNQSNRVIMLIGDSISRNSIEALECILSIESGKMVTISPPVVKVLWGGTRYTITVSSSNNQSVNIQILYFAVWTPYANGAGKLYMKEARRMLKHQDPTIGIVFVFNIGMHERHEPTQRIHVADMIQFARKKLLQMENRTNMFLYRESSAQHYNSTAGYFNFKHSAAWKSKKMPLPTCVPYDMVKNDENDWRYKGEQGAFDLTKFNRNNVIPFRKISRHYFDMHSSSPFFKHNGQKKGPDRDCTHYNIHASPILYRLLWYEILKRATSKNQTL